MQSLHCFHIFSQKNEWDKTVITFVCKGTFIQLPLHSQNTLLAKRNPKSHQAHSFGTGRLTQKWKRKKEEEEGGRKKEGGRERKKGGCFI